MKVRKRPPSTKDESVEPRGPEDQPAGWPPPTEDSSRLLKLAMDRRCIALVCLVLASLLYFAVSTVSNNSRAQPTLIKAFVAFRHGSRAPGFTYNKDPYHKDDEKLWPDGPGELTKAGKYEAYELGMKLRERYKDFIGDYYKPKEFRGYSTLIERTLMSAQLVLASLFPPQGYQDWNSEMNWQPVPVYPETIINDTSGTSCPRFVTEFKHNLKQIIPSDIGIESGDARLLQENTGEVNMLPFSLFPRVWDTVYFQDKANLPIPDWLKPLYPHKMTVTALKFLRYYLIGSHYQRLLVLGPYGSALTSYFTRGQRKMELHSWHDVNIMGLLLLLGIEVETYPEPSCAVAVELHNKNGDQYFEVYYYPNSKAKQPVQMTMPCGMSCPLSHLVNITEAYITDNYEELCRSSDASPAPLSEFKLHF